MTEAPSRRLLTRLFCLLSSAAPAFLLLFKFPSHFTPLILTLFMKQKIKKKKTEQINRR